MKTYLLCLPVLIIAAVMLMADGHTDAAAPQRYILTVLFNANLGNALNAMERNIEDFHKVQETYTVEMTLVPEGAYNDRILVAGQTGDLPERFSQGVTRLRCWLDKSCFSIKEFDKINDRTEKI